MQLHERLGGNASLRPNSDTDAFADLKNRVHQAVITDLGR